MCVTENGTGDAGPYTLDEEAYTRCRSWGSAHRGRERKQKILLNEDVHLVHCFVTARLQFVAHVQFQAQQLAAFSYSILLQNVQ